MTGRAGRRAVDFVVIGAGHNGLVCAATLARAGRSVLVLEAGARIGGASATREFAPGYRVSACAHLLHSMPSALRKELRLGSFGLAAAARALPTTALSEGGEPLAVEPWACAVEPAARAGYESEMGRFAAALAPLLERRPPRLGSGRAADWLEWLRAGLRMRSLGRRDLRELLRIGGMNVHDLLEERFESRALKGALALDAVLGTNFGPRSPGTVFTLLYRLAGAQLAGADGPELPRGGMGAVCDALAAAAGAAGASLRTSAAVARIEVANDRAAGVVLADGERIDARAVVSSADPKTTLLGLVGARHLDAGFVRRVDRLRTRGLAAKLHLALDRAPRFAGLPPARLASRLLIAPSMADIERAFDCSKYGEFPAAPIMEITVPSAADPGLAPPGRHVLSAIVQYAPYALAGGWDGNRSRVTAQVVSALERFAPGIRDSIVASELLAPPDIEREFRITGGHWHHADLAFDQFHLLRPTPGAAHYRAPLPGLYLCGAGSHPGGGVIGVAGRNAALCALDDGE